MLSLMKLIRKVSSGTRISCEHLDVVEHACLEALESELPLSL